ncbi:hypothetical protein GCM10009809_37970 [Isoptericola hypogeus]|uniref:Uncharacterized protein n=1 Tax=Isoptericola hypogeus TaxID=300179 RepID=A0ABP4VXW7_9MICO
MPRGPIAAAAVLLAGTVLGTFSIGMFFAPSAVCAVVAVLVPVRRAAADA